MFAQVFIADAMKLATSTFQENQPLDRITDWGWLIIILLVILVLAWRLIANRSADAPHIVDDTGPGSKATSVEFKESPTDDLAIIEGIGPKITALLHANGIKTFDQLAESNANYLRDLLRRAGLRIADPTTWPEQARLAANGDRVGLSELQDRLKAGRRE